MLISEVCRSGDSNDLPEVSFTPPRFRVQASALKHKYFKPDLKKKKKMKDRKCRLKKEGKGKCKTTPHQHAMVNSKMKMIKDKCNDVRMNRWQALK